MDFELKFWHMVAVGAIILLGWFIKRLVDNLDRRLDNQDAKLDKIISRQEIQGKQLLMHEIAIRANFPDFIVKYQDNG